MNRKPLVRASLWLAAIFAPALFSPSSALQPEASEAHGSEGTSSDDALTVSGTREKEIRQAIVTYTRALTDFNPTGPIARYQPGFYCPVVLGLDDADNERISDRMRVVANAAGVKPALKGCIASALVFIVDDKSSFLSLLKREHPSYFIDPRGGFWSPSTEQGPAFAWQLVQEMNPNGQPLARAQLDTSSVRVVSSTQGGSHLHSMISLAVATSIVIIERKALAGLTTTQIADYALMRSLSDGELKDMKDAGQFSILSVLDAPMDSITHASLTEWDFAYIQGRYSGDARNFGTRQAAIIQASITDTVIKKPER